MENSLLPKAIKRVVVPPIKCQGIKTKLVNFIATSVKWHGEGKWIEPFLGSGVVLFNINPKRALVSDTNKYIINFYQDVQNGRIDEKIVKDYLHEMGTKLLKGGEDFYYAVREQFNKNSDNDDSLKVLFLNRCCYNGIMRFNAQGKFNVPFGHKPERFRRAYVTKIVNQVSRIRRIIQESDWKFQVSDWRETMASANPEDFVYMDPPYIGRHTDYFNNWTENDAIELAKISSTLKCGFALSMWQKNKYRENLHLDSHWKGFITNTFSHFYHVGSKEEFRNEITEALVLKAENAVESQEGPMIEYASKQEKQMSMFS